jgi:hypothetical protein
VKKLVARWCAWCGDDLNSDVASHFCDHRCERHFWNDVYRADEDPSVVHASLREMREESVS